MDNVKKVYRISGVYDILIKIEFDHVEKIRTITQKIRKMEKIRSKLTLMVIEDQ
jgi:DNA-binding Lrp family transcriptional regulator